MRYTSNYTNYSFPLNSGNSGNTRTYQIDELVIAEGKNHKILIGIVKKNKGFINKDVYYAVEDFNGVSWDVPYSLIKWSLPKYSDCYNEFINEVKFTPKNSVKEYKDFYFELLTIHNAKFNVGDYVHIPSLNDFGIIKQLGCASDKVTPEYIVSTIHNSDKFVIEPHIIKSTYSDYRYAYDTMNFKQPNEHIAEAKYQIERLEEQVNYLMGESIKARDDIKSISTVDQKVILSHDCCIPQVDILEDKFKKHEKRMKLLVALGAAFI